MKNLAPLYCVCGFDARERADASGHRRRCRKARSAVKAEMQRIAAELGHAPTTVEWNKSVDRTVFPSASWICVNYDGWNAFLRECSLEPTHIYDDGRTPARALSVAPPRYYWDIEREAEISYGWGCRVVKNGKEGRQGKETVAV